MRRILILLLVVGILAGTVTAIGEFTNVCFQSDMDFPDDVLTGNPGDPVPCGGGESGGGGGTPG